MQSSKQHYYQSLWSWEVWSIKAFWYDCTSFASFIGQTRLNKHTSHQKRYSSVRQLPRLQCYRYQPSKSFGAGLLRKSQNVLIKTNQTNKKIPTETCPDLIKENVQSIVKDIVVYVSENALMEHTGEAEIHEKKIVLH